MTTLLGISGSLRKEATNRYLIRNAATAFGADTYVEADLNLPLYDGDVEKEDGIRDCLLSRGLGDVYKRQDPE